MADLALFAGLNKYPTCPLDGCEDDVVDGIDVVVQRRGFDKTGIQLITDERATTQALLDGCNRLVAKARPGDRVLFWFAGHTAQVPCAMDSDDPDGLSEALCPIDFDWTNEHMITDKQLHAIFSQLPNDVHFNWISDSCHSAGLTRDMPRFVGDGFLKTRGFPVPADIAWHTQLKKEEAARNGIVSRDFKSELNVGFMSACREDQKASDGLFNLRPNGALSYFLIKTLREVDRSTPLFVIRQIVLNYLIAARYIQEPQVIGPLIHLPFL